MTLLSKVKRNMAFSFLRQAGGDIMEDACLAVKSENAKK